MSEYRIEQRAVEARILTARGWLRGTFNPPRAAYLTDYLNHAPPFLNITAVLAEGGTHTLGHLSIQKRAIVCVVPLADDRLEAVNPIDNRVEHEVYCLLRDGSINARLQVMPHVRVSDYFMNREGFIVLEGAVGHISAHHHAPEPVELGTVILNTWNVVGVSEISWLRHPATLSLTRRSLCHQLWRIGRWPTRSAPRSRARCPAPSPAPRRGSPRAR